MASAPLGLRPFTSSVAMGAAEAVPQTGYLGDDQVNEAINQLVEHLQVLVLFEAAQTLPVTNTGVFLLNHITFIVNLFIYNLL